ncbi:MAG: neutral/alkaline non-lysosomal ceramidase N-terminal domain-containing protein [Bryobacteraceae bacterium]
MIRALTVVHRLGRNGLLLPPDLLQYKLYGMDWIHWAGCSVLSMGLTFSAVIPAVAGQIKAGYAKTDVTPQEPVNMAGYDLRGTPSDGIHGNDKLYVRAVVFDDGTQRLAIVEGDVIIIRDTDEFRRRIAAATGIPFANILLGDVHNHAAPSPEAKTETKWEQEFDKALVATVKKAVASLQPVRIAAGQGRSRIGMNRRHVRPQDTDSTITFDENNASQSFGKFNTDNPQKIHEFAGVMRLGANPGGEIDDAVDVVRIDTIDGKPLAAMIHYACHGTSLGGRNSKISGEWMGRMQEYLEKHVPGVGSIYLQGGAGDINPRVVGGLDGYRDNVETTWALGEEIGREVVRVYRSLQPEPLNASLEVVSADIQLPRAYRELLENFRNTVVPAPTTFVRMGDLMWVTFPGEMFHVIAQRVKQACPATHAFFMGYTNGYIGYFPEQKSFAEGGYEPAVSHLDPAAEGSYMRQIAETLKHFR